MKLLILTLSATAMFAQAPPKQPITFFLTSVGLAGVYSKPTTDTRK